VQCGSWGSRECRTRCKHEALRPFLFLSSCSIVTLINDYATANSCSISFKWNWKRPASTYGPPWPCAARCWLNWLFLHGLGQQLPAAEVRFRVGWLHFGKNGSSDNASGFVSLWRRPPYSAVHAGVSDFLQLLAVPQDRRPMGVFRVGHRDDRSRSGCDSGLRSRGPDTADDPLPALRLRHTLGADPCRGWRQARRSSRQLRSEADRVSSSSPVRWGGYVAIPG